MSIDRGINSNPVLAIREPPHQQFVPLCTLFIVAVPHKEVPCYSIISEAIERKDLCPDVVGRVISCLNKKDRIACAREIGRDRAFKAIKLASSGAVYFFGYADLLQAQSPSPHSHMCSTHSPGFVARCNGSAEARRLQSLVVGSGRSSWWSS
jgi:hypothetical protein